MVRNPIRSRIPVFGALALLFVTGCPATCQTTRERKIDDQWKIKIGETQLEDRQTTLDKRPTVKKHLRPDGTPWLIETDGGELLTEKLKLSNFTNLNGERDRHEADRTVNVSWWRLPVIVLICGVIGAGLALLIAWRFYGWPIRR